MEDGGRDLKHLTRSAVEEWLIGSIRDKRELDIFGYATPGGNQLGIDPHDPNAWSDNHKLTGKFVEELLTAEAIDGTPLPDSLWLTRFWCTDGIDLSGSTVRREVIFELCRFEGEFCARASKFESNLNFSRCSVGSMLMDDCAVGGTFRVEGRVRGDFWAMNGKFARSLTLWGTVEGEVSLERSEIEQGLYANGLTAHEINLEGITVKSALNLSNANVDVGVWCADIVAECSFYLGGLQTSGSIEFSRSRINGSIDLANVHAVRIIGENASVAGDIFVTGARTGSISLISTEIRDDLRLESASITGDLLLLRARVGGYLILSTESGEDITWSDDSRLVLTDLSVEIFTTTLSTLVRPDRRATTPSPVSTDFVDSELSGFRFRRIGSEGSERSVVSNGARDLVAWIESSNRSPDLLFNPTPYTNFSAALRNTGFNREADDLLVALYRHKMISRTQPRSTRFVLFLSWLLIGFGYRAERAVFALLVFVILGVAAGLISEGWHIDLENGSIPNTLMSWLWASIENTIPFVRLGQDEGVVEAQKDSALFAAAWNSLAVLGTITAAFLLAAISGFARRRYR